MSTPGVSLPARLPHQSHASARGRTQTEDREYPNARPSRFAPTSPFHHYAVTNRLILAYLRGVLGTLRGTGVNVGAGTLTYGECLPDTATMWCVDIRSQPESNVDVLSDIQACGIATGCLDWILCTSVLEHIPDPRCAMVEMARCLKPGGRLIMTVPQTFPLHAEPADFWRFTSHGIRLLATEAGLAVASLTPLGQSRSVRWQQRASRFHSRYGGRADHSLSLPKRLVLNALRAVSLLHNAACCIAAAHGRTESRACSDALCWGALLVKQDPHA